MYSISMFDLPILFLIAVMLKWFVDAEVAAGVIGHTRNVIEEHVEDQNSFLMQSLMRMLM